MLTRKVYAAVVAASEELAEQYRTQLLEKEAPPHSRLGEIPRAYLGWKPGGYGPTNPTGINNIGQVDNLASYIDFEADDTFGASAAIGFRPSHADGDNYLIAHDREGRPWIRPIIENALPAASSAAKQAFER